MRHRRCVRFSMACVALCSSLGTLSAQTSPAEREVMQAIDQINAAFQGRDVKACEALTTADFVRVTSPGRVIGRDDWLKNVAAPGAARAAAKHD